MAVTFNAATVKGDSKHAPTDGQDDLRRERRQGSGRASFISSVWTLWHCELKSAVLVEVSSLNEPHLATPLQVTQIRIAGDPSYDTRYAFIEFTAPEEVWIKLSALAPLTAHA